MDCQMLNIESGAPLTPDARKDWRREEKGMTEDEIVGWHHWLNGHEFQQAPGVGDGQGGLACCSPWCYKESAMTERLNWTELNWTTNLSKRWWCPGPRQWKWRKAHMNGLRKEKINKQALLRDSIWKTKRNWFLLEFCLVSQMYTVTEMKNFKHWDREGCGLGKK